MKKILIVAYFFPPFREVGSFRVRKLVKYFSQFGWDITVLTVKEKFYDKSTIGAYDDIPSNVRVIRTSRINQFTKFKEQGLYWIKDLMLEQYKLLRKEKFDYSFYTGGPFIHFILAPIFKRIFKQGYILDFRDPWLLTPYNSSRLRKNISKILEPICVKNAEYIINVTEDATQMYMKNYRKTDMSKFITVTNGYDPDDFKVVKTESIDLDGIALIYAGKLGSFRNIVPLLEAIEKNNINRKKKFYLYHIGNTENQINDYLKNNIFMKNYIKQLGFMPYDKVISYIKLAEAGVIISGGHPYEPTTKIYDYIALNKKIICINDINYGYLHDTLGELEGCFCSKNNCNDIIESLSKLEKEEYRVEYDKSKFSRKEIFRNLDKLLIYNIK